MIMITEKDDRLLLQFWQPKFSPEGTISIENELAKEIDISGHIERAVRKALADQNVVHDALLAACKAALGAFEHRHAIDWDDLQRAIDLAEGKAPPRT